MSNNVNELSIGNGTPAYHVCLAVQWNPSTKAFLAANSKLSLQMSGVYRGVRFVKKKWRYQRIVSAFREEVALMRGSTVLVRSLRHTTTQHSPSGKICVVFIVNYWLQTGPEDLNGQQ